MDALSDQSSDGERFAYKGWAPCMHDDEETKAALAWLEDILGSPSL
jgi:hypothetical protein